MHIFVSFQSHRGLYDEWKSVPFIDDTDDNRKQLLGEYVNALENPGTSSNIQDKYLEIYNKYNREHDRVIGDGNESGDIGDRKYKQVKNQKKEKEVEQEMASIKPLEGGLEDMTEKMQEPTVERSHRKGRKNKSKNERRHRKNREERKKKRGHKNSVKKDLSRKYKKNEKAKKKLVDEQKKQEEEKDQLEVSMEKFYSEHPDFKKNVATITDGTITQETTENPEVVENQTSVQNTNNDQANQLNDILSESYDDEHTKDIYDDQDDFDDAAERHMDSQSADESSEMFNEYYDYYDEDGDSSYSSSEQRAELEMLNQTPVDWHKHLNQMQGDQPAVGDNKAEDDDNDSMEEIYQKYIKNMKKSMVTETPGTITNEDTPKDEDDGGDLVKKTDLKREEPIPKTDIEPSTSPNPPTSKMNTKPAVTDPTYPQWKERVETWNLIESKPVGKSA